MPHHPVHIASVDALAASTADAERDPHVPESIPPWVHVNEDNEDAPFLEPAPTVPNTRHYKPPSKYSPGRKWDHVRNAEPPLLSAQIADAQTRWMPFMQSGPNPSEVEAHGVVRSASWMAENVAAFGRQWEEQDEEDPLAAEKMPKGFKGFMYRGKWLISPERQEKSVRLFWNLLLKNAFVPLGFRIVTITFSGASVGIAGTILHNVQKVNNDNDPDNQCAPRASTYMGIILGAIAIPYVAYVTYDEYFSKPLGLRSAFTKTILLLWDLYFIVFSASNLTLAFSAVLDVSWACYEEAYLNVGDIAVLLPRTCPNNQSICYKQRALTGVLVVSLVAWMLCFSTSVLRVVEKLRVDY